MNIRLFNKGEMKIMEALWDSGEDMTSNDMTENLKNEHFGKVAVYKAVQTLLDDGFIKINGMEQSTKVYARKFSPQISREEYIAFEIEKKGIKMSTVGKTLAAFLGRQNDKKKGNANYDDKAENEKLIQDLEKIIEQIRKGNE